MNKKRRIKLLVFIMAIIFVSQTVFLTAFINQSSAVMPVVSTDPGAITQRALMDSVGVARDTSKEIKQSLSSKIFDSLVLAATISVRNYLVDYAKHLGNVTLDTIATGDAGESPIFYTRDWKQHLDYAGGAAVAKFFDTMSQEYPWFKSLNTYICEPRLDVKIRMLHSLAETHFEGHQPQPRCTFMEMVNNWDVFVDDLQSKFKDPLEGSLTVMEMFSAGFTPEENDVGIYLTLADYTTKLEYEAEDIATKEREEVDGGVKPVTSDVSETIRTPSRLREESLRSDLEEAKSVRSEELKMAGDLAKDIPLAVAGSFLNTVFSRKLVGSLRSAIERGLATEDYSPENRSLSFVSGQKQFSQSVQKAAFSFSENSIDFVTLFSSCPQDATLVRNPNNCIINDDFRSVLQQDELLTVREAVNSGQLADMVFIGPNDSENLQVDCFQKGYCYSNLKKLRKARIIPIGWEIAASKVSYSQNITLKKIINDFDDEDSDFYHLIDPNWILKDPAAQCRINAYGPTLLGAGSDVRAETCVDMKTCLQENEDGDCLGGWGYCAVEKNVWRLGGDSCPDYYNSCQSLTRDSDGAQVNYLTNTLDDYYTDTCHAGNYGCTWYSTNKKTDNTWSTIDKTYLNKKATEQICSPESEGCSRFIKTEKGLGTNLIANGGFEEYTGTLDDGQVDEFANFSFNNTTAEVVSDSYDGGVALKVSGTVEANNIVANNKIDLSGSNYNRYYLLSAGVKFLKSNTTFHLRLKKVGDSGYVNNSGEESELLSLDNTKLNTWQEFRKVIKVTPKLKIGGSVGEISLTGLLNGSVIVDNIQLEELDNVSEIAEYNEYDTRNIEYIKKAPEYYNCDDPATASAECSDFAQECSVTAAGCKGFSPTDGGETISGVIGLEDYCPQECAGYQTFSQVNSQFDSSDFVEFIPSSAKTCSASNSGCTEFTNLDELTAGGEVKEYFTELRECIKPDENSCGSFYTWVGSANSGYQLQGYYLQKKSDGSLLLPAGDLNKKNGIECTEELFVAQTDPDCRQFYNEAGAVSYEYYSKTKSCSEDCHPYRQSNVDSVAECKGSWENNSQCIYYAIPEESKTCSASVAGCREYKGNFGGDEEIIFEDNFEDGLGKWTSGQISNESAFVGGHSLLVGNKSTNNTGNAWTKSIDNLKKGVAYNVSFWAKRVNSGTGEVSFVLESLNNKILINNSTEWKYYEFNFSEVSWDVTGIESLHVNNFLGYIDNFKIKNLTDVNYLIKDSWSTPMVCNQDLITSTELDGAQLGCREYLDQEGVTHYLKNISSVCAYSDIGCQSVINTANSGDVTDDVYNYLVVKDEDLCSESDKGCKAYGLPELTVDVEGDEQIKTDKDGKELWNVAYYKLNPDLEDNYTCQILEAGCEKFVDSQGKEHYFKDPGDKTCEYKVVNDGTEYQAGWYKTGTKEVCETQDEYGAQQPTSGWVGVCSDNDDQCTAFEDVNKNEYYYYINNDSLDYNCSGVSEKEGCLLFDDKSNEQKFYNSYNTYLNSSLNNFDLIVPVDKGINALEDFGKLTDGQGSSCSTTTMCVKYLTCLNSTGGDYTSCQVWADACGQSSGECTTAYYQNLNDSNKIIKVKRDRDCAQWYACQASHYSWDSDSQGWVEVCDQIGLCSEINPDDGSCKNWVMEDDIYSALDDRETFEEADYIDRDTSWSGYDYSGYAILNQYPLHYLSAFDVTNSADKDFRLVYVEPETTCESVSECPDKFVCLNNRCVQEIDGSKIDEKDGSESPDAICRVYPEENAPFPKEVKDNSNNFSNANICYGDDCECSYVKYTFGGGQRTLYYPVTETPILEKGGICQELNDENQPINCLCDKSDSSIKSKTICQDTELCGKDSYCLKTDNNSVNYTGLEGYCLEYDTSTYLNGDREERACLNWYPVDLPEGVTDIYNQYKGAGFEPVDGKKYACLESAVFEYIPSFFSECVDLDESYNNESCDGGGTGYYDGVVGWADNGIKLSDEKGYIEYYTSSDAYTNPGEVLEEMGRAAWQYFEGEDGECPDGFFPVFGPCGNHGDNEVENFNYSCASGGSWTSLWIDNKTNKSGLMCVPNDSKLVILDENDPFYQFNGQSCHPGLSFSFSGANSSKDEYNYYVDPMANACGQNCNNAFSLLYPIYQYCQLGAIATPKVVDDKALDAFYEIATNKDANGKFASTGSVLGCYRIGQVVDDNDDNKVWTGRVSNDQKTLGDYYNWQDNYNNDYFNFSSLTNNLPFGLLDLTDASTKADVQLFDQKKEMSDVGLNLLLANSSESDPEGSPYYNFGRTYDYIKYGGSSFCVNSEDCGIITDDNYCKADTSDFGSWYFKASCDADLVSKDKQTVEFDINFSCSCDGVDYLICLKDKNKETYECERLSNLSDKFTGNFDTDKVEFKVFCLDKTNTQKNVGAEKISNIDKSYLSDDQYLKGCYLGIDKSINKMCRNDNDCKEGVDQSCKNNKCYINGVSSQKEGFDYSSFSDNNDTVYEKGLLEAYNSWKRLKNIFKKVYSVWTWSLDLYGGNLVGGYDKVTSQTGNGSQSIDDSFNLEGTSPPTLAAVAYELGEKVVDVKKIEDQISLNSLSSGDIIGYYGQKAVNLQFYAWADDNHMPLKEVKVSWGDGTNAGSTGTDNYYKNFKPVCDSDAGWGDQPDACTESFFSYSKVYTCSSTGSLPLCSSGDEGLGCWDTSQINPSTGKTGACVFVPKVQVKDSWGWCNGDCEGVNKGCWDGSDIDDGVNDCKDADAYTKFNGKVIVFP